MSATQYTVCNKTAHHTQRDAERQAAFLESRSGFKTNAYKCKRCGSWHVGRYRTPAELGAFVRRRERARNAVAPKITAQGWETTESGKECLRQLAKRDRMRELFAQVPTF